MAKLSKKETVNIPANESMEELLQRIASMPDMGNEFVNSLGYERVEPEPERGKGIFGQPVQVPVTWGTGTAPAYTRYQPTVESTVGGELLTGSLPFMVTTPLFGLPQLAGFLAVDNLPKVFNGNSITGSVGNLTEKAYDLIQKDPEKQAKYGPIFNDLGALAGGIGVGAAESAYARGVLDRATEYALRIGDHAPKEMMNVWRGEENGATGNKLNNKWDFIKHALFNKGKTGTPFQQDNMYYTGRRLLNDYVNIDRKSVANPKYKSDERSFDIIDNYIGRRKGQLDQRYYVPSSLDDLPANALKRIEEGLWPGAKPKVYKIADNFTGEYYRRRFAKDFARMPDTVQPDAEFVISTSGTDLYDPGHMVRYPMTDPLTGQHYYRAFDIQKYGNSETLNNSINKFLGRKVPAYVREKISKLPAEWMRGAADRIVKGPLDYLAKPETAANFTNWIDRKHNPFVMYWDEPIDEAEYIAELGRLANGAKSAAKNTGIDLTKGSSGSVSKGLAEDFVGTAKYLGLSDDVIKKTLDTASDSEITKIMNAWDGLKADSNKAGIDIKDKLQNFDWGDFELMATPKAKEDLHTALKAYEDLTEADQNLIETLKESNNIIENPTISDLSALKQQLEYSNKAYIQKKYNIPKEDVNINFNLDDLVSKITKPTESELEAAQNLLSDYFAKTLAGLTDYPPTSIKFYTSAMPVDTKLKVLNLLSDGNEKEAINLLSSYIEKELPFACGGHINRYAYGGNKIKANAGDSWIKIANDSGISLADLLYWNGIDPTSKEQLPVLQNGQEVYISDPYTLNSSFVSAIAPNDYVDYGYNGRDLIDKYARAIRSGNATLNDVPSYIQDAVLQKTIYRGTDSAANTIANAGINLAAMLADPVGYAASVGSQKALAYTNDAISGRNEYGLDDLIDYTPIKGTQYASEHPFRAALGDALSGMSGGMFIRNLPTIVRNARNAAQNAVAATGLTRNTFPKAIVENGEYHTSYKSGTKGSGKTGTATRGKGGSGYKSNTSSKGSFSNTSTSDAPSIYYVSENIPVPFSPSLPFTGAIPAVGWAMPKEQPVSLLQPDNHIREEQTLSRWQMPNSTGEISDYVPGTGLITIKGNAPIGNTVYEQPLTEESTVLENGTYTPRKAVYVRGDEAGTPIDIYSGLGINYGSSNPGSLIVGRNGYAGGGDIDFSGIKTTNNRKYNPEYISYINTALDNANVSNTKKAAILANIIEESGGNPFGLDKTGNFYGLLQWWNDRYAPTEEKDIYSEIDNQTKYLLNTLGNKTDSVSWTHGGKGTGYQSFEDAMRDFDSDDLATAMRGFTLGYVRPAGKLDSLANRMKVAQQIYDMFNSTSGAKVDRAINMISPVAERNPGLVRRLIESAKRKNSGGFR